MNFPRFAKSRLPILLAATLLFSGCAYFNTFYNARKYYREGLDLKAANQPTPAKAKFEKAIEKSALVIQRWPRSRWADDALLLIGLSYYHQGYYDKAMRNFDQLPLDPCCGRPFRYEPQGWPRDTRWLPHTRALGRWSRPARPGEEAVFVIRAGCPFLWSPGYVDVPAASPSGEPPTVLMQRNETAYSGYLFPLDPPNDPLP